MYRSLRCIAVSSLLGTPFMLYPTEPLQFLVAVSAQAGIIGMILPALMGTMINTVPPHMRALASGISPPGTAESTPVSRPDPKDR